MKVRRALPTLIATCATMCILMPSVAHAANTTCANADFLFLNERASQIIGASGNLYFKTNVTAEDTWVRVSRQWSKVHEPVSLPFPTTPR